MILARAIQVIQPRGVSISRLKLKSPPSFAHVLRGRESECHAVHDFYDKSL